MNPPQPPIVRSMSLLLAGAALLATDVTVGLNQTETVTTWGSPDPATETGFLIDVFPDELGAALLALAFLALRRVASGALRGWFALLVGLQGLIFAVALTSHGPQEAVAQEGFHFDWRGSLPPMTMLIAGWSLTALAGRLDLPTSQRRWRRFATYATVGHLVLFCLAVLFAVYTSTQGEEPTWTALAVAASVLAGLGLALTVTLAYFGITACLAMRAEAKAP